MNNKRAITLQIMFSALAFLLACNSSNEAFNSAADCFTMRDYNCTVDILTKTSIQNKNTLKFKEYKLRGMAYSNLHHYKQGIDDFKKCLLFHMEDNIVLFRLAECYLGLKMTDSAIIYYNKILKSDKNNWNAYNQRGVCLLQQKKIVQALSDFKASIKINSSQFAGYNNIGLSYENLAKYRVAINYYGVSISKNHLYSDVYFNRGVSYMYLNKPDSALVDYNTAIKLDGKNSIYYLNRGMAKSLLGSKRSACEDWDKSLSMGNKEVEEYLNNYCK
jgi:tetratricopeptide (TPR) repeat protein